MMKYIWKVWAASLGEKANEGSDTFSDHVALFRTAVVLVNFLTCFVITAGIIHHW
jgi:hypothetical protein